MFGFVYRVRLAGIGPLMRLAALPLTGVGAAVGYRGQIGGFLNGLGFTGWLFDMHQCQMSDRTTIMRLCNAANNTIRR